MIAKLIEMSLIGTKADEQNTQKQNSQKRKVDDVGIDLIQCLRKPHLRE